MCPVEHVLASFNLISSYVSTAAGLIRNIEMIANLQEMQDMLSSVSYSAGCFLLFTTG
jgi:hypothetical protein